MFRCSLLLLASLLGCLRANAAAEARKLSDTSWSIGNEFVERIVTFDRQKGLETDNLRYKPTGRDFISHARHKNGSAGEFSFYSNDRGFTGEHSFRLAGSETSNTPGGKLLRIDLSASDVPLAVSVFYVVYDDHPALRKWLTVTNRGTSAIYLSHFCFEQLEAGPGSAAELQVSAGYGATPRELYYTGRVSDPAIFVRNAATGEGFAIVNEAPGYLKRTEVGSGWSEKFMVMYDTDLFPFGRTLAPAESFESAKSSLIFFSDGHGLADSRWVVPRYAAQILSRRHGAAPPWIYNTWEPFLRGINEQTVKELAQAAEQIGIDIFTIDDGWQAEYGSNDFDRTRFPAGFAGVKSILDSNHLRIGLWVPLAAISTEAPDYRSHPEWVCRDRSGRAKFTGTAAGQRAVMCLASGYRDLALRRLTNVVERYQPAYIKVDLTTVFNAYGEEPGCYATGHSHQGWAESLTRIYEALQYIGEQLYRTHPEVSIDYTFELWGEKHLIDPGLLRSADFDWLSNVSDAESESGGPLHARTLLYSRSPSIPTEAMLIGNLRAPTPSAEERFATEIGSGPLLLGDLRRLSSEERDWYSAKIRWYKDFRRRTSLSDSFFPIGNWMQPNAASWDGFARLSRDADGMIVLFKNRSRAESAEIRLPVPHGFVYQVKSIITNETRGAVSADDLARGWNVKLPSDHAVEILELDRSTRSAPKSATAPASRNALVNAPVALTMKPVTAGPMMPEQFAIRCTKPPTAPTCSRSTTP
jgi:alpha-galactosidase